MVDKADDELGGWQALRSGEWLWRLIHHSFQTYWERATASYFLEKYPNLDQDQIAEKLIAVAAKNASLLGAATAAAVSTDEIVALLTAGGGGIGLPANIAIGMTAVSTEAIMLMRIQLELVANLGKLYDAPLDPNDPEDILTILAFASRYRQIGFDTPEIHTLNRLVRPEERRAGSLASARLKQIIARPVGLICRKSGCSCSDKKIADERANMAAVRPLNIER